MREGEGREMFNFSICCTAAFLFSNSKLKYLSLEYVLTFEKPVINQWMTDVICSLNVNICQTHSHDSKNNFFCTNQASMIYLL